MLIHILIAGLAVLTWLVFYFSRAPLDADGTFVVLLFFAGVVIALRYILANRKKKE